jgi:hypothetical protein
VVLQEIWNKFNPRERLSAIGAGVIIVGWLISLTSFGVGGSVLALLAGLIVLGVLYAKHAPNLKVAWPVDPSLINLAVSGLAALLVLVGLLSWVGFLGLYGGTALIALLLTVVGTALLVWGAWQEYSAVKPALPAFLTSGGGTGTSTGAATTPPAGSAAAAPAAPAAPPAAPAAMDDRDEAPPA